MWAPTDAKGVKGGVPASVPRGGFGSKSVKMARNEPTNASKGYSGPPESIPMVSDHFHFSQVFGLIGAIGPKAVANSACAPSDRGEVVEFQIFQTPFLKKVLREPGSNRAKIRRKSKLSETIGIDSGGPE